MSVSPPSCSRIVPENDGLFRMIPRSFTDHIRGRHIVIDQMHRHPPSRMFQNVAVIHPNPRIVGAKRHFIRFPRFQEHGVEP